MYIVGIADAANILKDGGTGAIERYGTTEYSDMAPEPVPPGESPKTLLPRL